MLQIAPPVSRLRVPSPILKSKTVLHLRKLLSIHESSEMWSIKAEARGKSIPRRLKKSGPPEGRNIGERGAGGEGRRDGELSATGRTCGGETNVGGKEARAERRGRGEHSVLSSFSRSSILIFRRDASVARGGAGGRKRGGERGKEAALSSSLSRSRAHLGSWSASKGR